MEWLWYFLPLAMLPLFLAFYLLKPECPACGQTKWKRSVRPPQIWRCQTCQVELDIEHLRWRYPMGYWRKMDGNPLEPEQ
jgi:hypothetical protein